MRLDRITRISLAALAAAGGIGLASPAAAQGPDIRNIRPYVVLLLDTSGSMEKLPACVCRTTACTECLPQCGSVTESQRNRWAMVTEALTGSWASFSCTTESRFTAFYSGQYDYQYYLPHHRLPTTTVQTNDGILDVYRDRVRFGLMTFDGNSTLSPDNALTRRSVFETAFFLAQSASAPGQYSYGNRRSFMLPGCPDEYMLDNGAQNASATSGRLISVGTETDDFALINQEIQAQILGVRPYGPTPIAGMLDDARYWVQSAPEARSPSAGGTDPYAACRDRYMLLVTDGYPNADMRETTYRCDTPTGRCPYQRPEEIAADLCRYGGGECGGPIDGLFVVGFNVGGDPVTVARLNDIALAGGTGGAYFAEDRVSLMASLAAAIDRAAPGTTTRTTPTFASSSGSYSGGGVQAQYQFNSGFAVTGGGQPWSGVLDRTRFECDSSLVPVEQPLTTARGDRFHEVLDARNLGTSPRRLLTVIPSNAVLRDQTLIGEFAGVSAEPFAASNPRVTRQMLGVTSTTRRDEIIAWVHGSTRTNRLGDIYHSSPTVIGPPRNDIADESFNLYRQDPRVALRPSVVYVGTNDGVMHAFASEEHRFTAGPHNGTTLEPGQELWGFVPPILLGKLDAASSTHQEMVDGTPTIREVYLYRELGDSPGTTADRWRTVMVAGLRGGGKGFFALDVTDPLDPKFLWQFTDADMGATYGRPAIAQVLVTFGGQLQERAVAILPGGHGAIDLTRTTGPIGCPAGGIGEPPVTDGTTTARANMRCWREREGRQLYIVDVQTGQLIKRVDHRVWNAPVTGGVSVFQGETGTLATRAFVTDQDGVLWRLDLSNRDPASWAALPFHDIFWDGEATRGQPGYEPPVLSVDQSGELIVIQATGDTDALDGTAPNRVVSLRENLVRNSTGAITSAGASLNWEIRLADGEQVTGPLELFDGNVYFGTFQSTASGTDACAYGSSRLWGVAYIESVAGSPTPRPAGAIEEPVGSGTIVSYLGPFANEIIMGVGITKRPSCFEGETTFDPYFGGSRYRVTDSGGGGFELVAQVSGRSGAASASTIATIRRELPTPAALSRIDSFAGSVD